jgi:hypothetical protein
MVQRGKMSEEQLAHFLPNQWIEEWEKRDVIERYREQFLPPPVYCSYYDAGSCEPAARTVNGTCVKNPLYRDR